LAAGDDLGVADELNPVGAAATDAAHLGQAWRAVTGGLGGLDTIDWPVLLGSGPNYLDYEVDVSFGRGVAHVEVRIDGRNRIDAPVITPGPSTGIPGR
jgi:hypothetical protein